MGKPHKELNLVLFLLGLFSMTQIRIIGAIGISEIPIFIIAPFMFLKDYRTLKVDGFLPIIWLSLLTCGGNCIASYMNETHIVYAIKGFATPYSIFAVVVVLHRLLRDNLMGYKWLLIGIAFSLIVNIFVFQQDAELSAFADGAVGIEAGRRIAQTSAIFWTSRIRPFVELPMSAWYTQVPLGVSVMLIFFFVVFSAVTTASGRGFAATAMASVVLLMVGRKKRKHMQFFKQHFGLFVVGCCAVSIILTTVYKAAAQSGLMGEQSRDKYERQMEDRKGVLGLLQGGRGEVFIGLTACVDKPIFGYGPCPIDKNDYVKRYYEKYGTSRQWNEFISYDDYLSSIGRARCYVIPAHSHLISFWLYYGIIGLVLWVYVLYLIVIYFKRYVDVVPQWFGYMAVTLPTLVWSIAFSPYGYRVATPLTICLLLFSRAISRGMIRPSFEMIKEEAKYN